MMGYTAEQTNVPVVKTTNCILVPKATEITPTEPAQPCIRCGMCAEACPAQLLPQQLFWYSQAEDFEKLEDHHLFDCIECGACSYVCPSNIPLVQYYRASKGTIRQLELARQQSDRARERFEARQERIAKAEAEKEAKRQARKKAAEEAKKKLAQQSKEKPSSDPKSEIKETNPTLAPADNALPKLERALSSAKSRVERAHQQLQDAQENNEEARIEPLSARLKQAELKVKEAEEKLQAFKSGDAHTTQSTANIKEKISLSPKDKAEKNIATLKKRIATAEEKLAEAQQANAPTVDALRQGVDKLQQKLLDAENDLNNIDDIQSPTVEKATQSAADLAIAKAQAKAAAQAQMSDEEKALQQLESLKQRLQKAKDRLDKAEKENNENVDAFRLGVEKLEQKLLEAQQD